MDAKGSAKKSRSQNRSALTSTNEPSKETTRRRSLVTWPLFLGALLPFGFSMYFHTHPPASAQIEKTRERTPLVFGQYMVDLRRVEAGHEVEHAWFEFMNKGDAPLTVSPAITSCQCLRTQYRGDKRVFQPGEHGKIDVFIETAKESAGQKEFQIAVPYQMGSKQGEEQLTFRVTLPEPQVALDKRALLFYPAIQTSEAEKTQVVSIIDTRPSPLSVMSLQPTSELTKPLSQAKVVDVVDEGHARKIVISVRVDGEIPDRSIRESIHVKTDDPQHKTIRIPIWIDGRRITLSHPSDGESGPVSASEGATRN